MEDCDYDDSEDETYVPTGSWAAGGAGAPAARCRQSDISVTWYRFASLPPPYLFGSVRSRRNSKVGNLLSTASIRLWFLYGTVSTLYLVTAPRTTLIILPLRKLCEDAGGAIRIHFETEAPKGSGRKGPDRLDVEAVYRGDTQRNRSVRSSPSHAKLVWITLEEDTF